MRGVVLKASGRRFNAKSYLATSTFTAESVQEHSFEVVLGRSAPEDHDGLVRDCERFLTAKQLNLSRLMAFPGVERVVLVVYARARAADGLVFALPPHVAAELARHSLRLEVALDAV
jgi:hypothetical protein